LSLANGDELGLIRLDGGIVICYDHQFVVINREYLSSFSSRIYEAEEVGFFRLEFEGRDWHIWLAGFTIRNLTTVVEPCTVSVEL